MDWLYSWDSAAFRFVNSRLSNPFFDWLMPLASHTPFFIPGLLLAAGVLVWRGGARGRVFAALALVVLVIGDAVICNSIKHWVGRPRPFTVLTNVHLLVGRTESASMPSSHAANWFAASALTFLFYRRALRVVLPLAILVAVSRVYNGVHYPSDVIAGALLGATYGAAIACGADALWRVIGRRWFPIWWARMPSLLRPESALGSAPTASEAQNAQLTLHWLRLGYGLIGLMLLVQLGYLASGRIELSEDEAYQWLWSKHLALSYYSKPPMIAYLQFLGTSLWGDTAFGVRFCSPIIGALLSLSVFRFVAREANVRAAFALLLAIWATPLLAAGGTLLTIDSPSVLFWTLAMISGWRAVRQDSTGSWAWTGLWLGLGFLSKYTALCQWASFALLFVAWPEARRSLRRPGPWLALAINGLCLVPVWIWNQQHNWVTLAHLHSRAGLEEQWRPTLRYLQDFLLSEAGLLNPIFFVGAIGAAAAAWRARRERPLAWYLSCMGTPLFLGYLLYTLRSRVQPNWIAPSVLPLFACMAVMGEAAWRQGRRASARWFGVGVGLGLVAVVLLHDTDLIGRITDHPLPPQSDPLTRVRGWQSMATAVAREREALLKEGKPVFLIGAHYGVTSLLAFYLPKVNSAGAEHAEVFYQSVEKPENQFYFWPGYERRKGETAIYVEEVKEHDRPGPPPERLGKEFASVIELGRREVVVRGRVIHTVRLFICRDLL